MVTDLLCIAIAGSRGEPRCLLTLIQSRFDLITPTTRSSLLGPGHDIAQICRSAAVDVGPCYDASRQLAGGVPPVWAYVLFVIHQRPSMRATVK
jgi:hypothetical protein